ncbi:MAG TPA: MBL fold metallo-hydrolase [Bryobacteraceae bacterium]|nr:MBL fold metallo-hydrolase [Bryobacteraceae bacterium]
MIQPVNGGRELLDEIESAPCPAPRIWWLGHSGFALKYQNAIVYVDPLLSATRAGRLVAPPFAAGDVAHAGLILCTHAHAGHLDPDALPAILQASRRAKVVMPMSVATHAHSLGIEYQRMVTTNADLRVEFLDDRIYAVPSAHPQLDWTPLGGYPYLGYLVRFGRHTIYHAGDGVPYDRLAERLRPYNVNVALLPIGGDKNFSIPEAAHLAQQIGAEWLVPMHYDMFPANAVDIDRFVEHLLEQHPSQRFKVFQCGEGWSIPTE